MTDRFKFRGGYETHGKIESLTYSDSFRDISAFFSYIRSVPFDTPIMQCTGLKDSKGNLIYESDIVTCAGYGGKVKALVTYDEEKGCFKTGNHKQSKIPRLLNKTCTIIGNLYENPEILEIFSDD